MSVDFNYPYQVSPDTPAVAAEVQENFNQLLDWIKTNYRQKDDTPNLTTQLVLPGEPTIPSHAVNLGYLEGTQLLPRGTIVDYGGDTAPSGYLLCDGSAYSTTGQYAGLFAVIGYKFGGASGTFNVPDLRKRVTAGRDGTVAAFDTVGKTGGTADAPIVSHTHPATLTINTDGFHQHTQYVRTNTGVRPQSGGSGDYYTSPPIYNLPEGTGFNGSHSHSGSSVAVQAPAGSVAATDANYPPFTVVNKIIKT